MRVVLDTNVWVSGIFFGGAPRKVLDLIDRGACTLSFTPATFTELEEVLLRPQFAPQRALLPFSIGDFLVLVKEHALVFPDIDRKSSIIKADPSDDKFLSCALAARASFKN